MQNYLSANKPLITLLLVSIFLRAAISILLLSQAPLLQAQICVPCFLSPPIQCPLVVLL